MYTTRDAPLLLGASCCPPESEMTSSGASLAGVLVRLRFALGGFLTIF
jgi:hypothetical protein